MGWNVTIYKLDAPPVEAAAPFSPRVIGGTEDVRRRLVGGLPGLWWAGRAGRLVGEGWVMEMTLWRRLAPVRHGNVDSVNVDVEGGGDPIAPLIHLCKQQGWLLFDDGSGEFVDLDRPSEETWEQVRSYADRRARLGNQWREILVYDLDGPPLVDEDLLYRRFPIGDADGVRELIADVIPEVVWSGRRGRARVDDTLLDFRVRSRGLVDTFSFRINGPDADEWIGRLCEPHGWSGYDLQVGDFAFVHDSSRDHLPVWAVEPLPSNVIRFPTAEERRRIRRR
jgi:hypothetical protein